MKSKLDQEQSQPDQKGLPNRIKACLDKISGLLAPPFDDAAEGVWKRFAKTLQEEIKAEAVSIFLISESNPYLLKYAAGLGYDEGYKGIQYSLQHDSQSLTSYLCRHKLAINASSHDLKAHKKVQTVFVDASTSGDTDELPKRPFSGRCKLYIKSESFNNIVASTITCRGKRWGVLKAENKQGTSAGQAFDESDFQVTQILAMLIGIALQERWYFQLWNEADTIRKTSKTREEYAQQITELLAKQIHAECSSLFGVFPPSEGHPTPYLKYIGGYGYTDTYQQKGAYSLETPPTAFTQYIAQEREIVRKTEAEIIATEGEIPYRGASIRWISTGSFRDTLSIPLQDHTKPLDNHKAPLLGVLKIENRLPAFANESFDEYDESVVKKLIEQQIEPALSRFADEAKGEPLLSAGVQLLVRKLGASHKLKGEELRSKARHVEKIRMKEKIVSVQDAVNYLQISSRQQFYRLLNPPKKRNEPEKD